MEALEKLSRRQVEALSAVRVGETLPKGVPLRVIAKALRVSSPSALDHLTALEELKLVERYRGKSRLTKRGTACLAEYQRHHRVAESLFQRAGLTPQETCHAAREIDLALSHETVDQICRAEGHPKVCPHGAPIDPCEASGSEK
jgi:Mn-dependent DtxR family transcriptional regulator